MLDNIPFPRMLEMIYRETGLPTIVFDVSFNLIAYCFDRPFYIAGWEQLASSGTASEEMVLANNYLQLEEEILANRSSLIVETAGRADFKTAFGPVFRGSALVAYVATIVEDVETNDVIRLNDLICKTFPINSSSYLLSSDEKVGEDILLENPVSEAILFGFLERHPGPYIVAIIQTETIGQAKQNYIKSKLENSSDHFAAFDSSNNIRILYVSANRSDRRTCILSQLREITEKYACRAGISDLFDQISHTHIGVIQAQLCIETLCSLRKKEMLASFPSCYVDAMCVAMIQSEGFDKRFYLRHIQQIQDKYPQRYPEFIRTLISYLSNGFNSTETARSLGIHKNSVNYRLRALRELLGLDLDDQEQTDALFLELSLYQALYAYTEENNGFIY